VPIVSIIAGLIAVVAAVVITYYVTVNKMQIQRLGMLRTKQER